MNFKLRNRNSKILALLVAVLFLFSFFPGYGLAEDTHQPLNSLMGPVNPPTDPGEVPGDKQGGEEPGTNPQGTLENPDDTSSDNQQGTLEEPDKEEGEDPEKTPQEELPLIPVIAEKVSLTIHHVLDLGEGKERLTYTDTIDDLDSRATVKGSDYQVCEEGIAFVGSEPEELVLGDGDNEITLLYNPGPIELPEENPDHLSGPQEISAPTILYPSSLMTAEFNRSMRSLDAGLLSRAPASESGPSEIVLSKQATPVTGTTNQWQVTLTITGKDLTQSSSADIVLVIDRSGSMGDNSRMANAKAAATSFVNTLLTPGNTSRRIAIVSFASNVTVDFGKEGNQKPPKDIYLDASIMTPHGMFSLCEELQRAVVYPELNDGKGRLHIWGGIISDRLGATEKTVQNQGYGLKAEYDNRLMYDPPPLFPKLESCKMTTDKPGSIGSGGPGSGESTIQWIWSAN